MKRWRWVLLGAAVGIVAIAFYAAPNRDRPPFGFLAGMKPGRIDRGSESIHLIYEFQGDYASVAKTIDAELGGGWLKTSYAPYMENWRRPGTDSVGLTPGRIAEYQPGWLTIHVFQVRPNWWGRLKRALGL